MKNSVKNLMQGQNLTEEFQEITQSSTYESLEIPEKKNKEGKPKKRVKFHPEIIYVDIENWKKYNDFQINFDDDDEENNVEEKKEENIKEEIKIEIENKKEIKKTKKNKKKRKENTAVCSCIII